MQKINLLNGLPPREKVILPFKVFKLIILAWIGLLVALYLIYYAIDWRKEHNFKDLSKQQVALKKQMIQLTLDKKGKNKDKKIQSSIKVLEKHIAEKKMILSLFKQKEKDMFSNYLELLSKETPDSVWLQQFLLSPRKKIFTVSGRSLKAPLVLQFANNLDKSDELMEYGLVINELKKNATADDFIFTISSRKKSK